MSGDSAPRVYGENHKEVLNKCLESLEQISSEREGKTEATDPLPLTYHPFYPSTAEENVVSCHSL